MKRLLAILTGLLLLLSVDGQILRYSNYVAPTLPEDPPSSDPPSFLTSDGYTEGWFIADEANVTKDVSDLVTEWDDLSSNDFDLANDGGTARPTWSVNGITFDGSDQLYNIEHNQAQPYVMYMVINQTGWTNFDRVFTFQGSDFILTQRNASPTVQFGANGTYTNFDDLTANTLGVLVVRINGASSKLQVNAGTPTTFNSGAGNLNDFNIGKEETVMVVREIIIRSVADDSTNETAILDYLMTKYSIE